MIGVVKIMKKLKLFVKKVFLSVTAAVILSIVVSTFQVTAAEFSVTEAAAILYTNENTVILLDADDNTMVLSEVEAGLPIQVTGITSNGYFQITLGGQTFYIHGIGLSAGELPETNDNTITDNIYDKLIAQKATFPEGTRWTNENMYNWKGGIYSSGYGCAAFAFALSDAAFGDARANIHRDYNNIRVGDILRINNDTHSVVILEVRPNSVIVAEGNFNNAVHWGREIPKSSLTDSSSYILTRYTN